MTDADAYEARVQVLTAEVRTLVVGSRQVTMSVYSQLDDVPPREIEPFGRVNPKDASTSLIWVVGRHTPAGALVSSYVNRDPQGMSDSYWKAMGDQYAHVTRDQLVEVAEQWSALPLIVLAGLR